MRTHLHTMSTDPTALTSYRSSDQHITGAIKNPFEEPVSRISQFTAIQIATLQSRLDKQLGPEYISTRAGPGGGRVHYLAAEKVINLANEVFGFNGWSSSIQKSEIDFVRVSNPSLITVYKITHTDDSSRWMSLKTRIRSHWVWQSS